MQFFELFLHVGIFLLHATDLLRKVFVFQFEHPDKRLHSLHFIL